MWKNMCKCLCALVLFALLFTLISPVFVPKNNTDGAGIHYEQAKGFLGETPGSFDVLFIGDSEAYSSFIPLRIWEQYGIASYVCSTPDQMLYQSYSFLERFSQKHSPKVVVLETNTLYREFTIPEWMTHLMEEQLPYLRYHDRWKSLRADDFGTEISFDSTVRDRGYSYLTDVVPADTEGYMAYSEEAEPVPMLNQLLVRQIRDFCEEQGIRLILVSTPSPTNWSYYYHNGVTDLAQSMGLEYIDLNLMQEEVSIDWEKDTYDAGDHMNYFGACKVTDYMGYLLHSQCDLADKRSDASYASWFADLEQFRKELLADGNA